MGPKSKEAVCETLGYLIDEAQQQRVLLQDIKSLLEQRAANETVDLVQVNKRVTELEKEFRRLHGPAAQQ